jgi:hypothetical protein
MSEQHEAEAAEQTWDEIPKLEAERDEFEKIVQRMNREPTTQTLVDMIRDTVEHRIQKVTRAVERRSRAVRHYQARAEAPDRLEEIRRLICLVDSLLHLDDLLRQMSDPSAEAGS